MTIMALMSVKSVTATPTTAMKSTTRFTHMHHKRMRALQYAHARTHKHVYSHKHIGANFQKIKLKITKKFKSDCVECPHIEMHSH